MSAIAAPAPSKALHYGLWALQLLLGFLFLMAGTTKLLNPPEQLVAMGMNFAGRLPAFAPKFIGLSEFLGAVGLILPSALRILPKLTGAAALGLVLAMVCAALEHAVHGEFGPAGFTVVLAALSGFVAWGRLAGAPIAAR